MQRIALSILLILSPVAFAQTPEQEEVPEIVAVVGAPFSAVGVQENVRVTADGNRFIHKFTTHHYRDGQGRTRLERELPIRRLAGGASEAPRTLVMINNKVTGEIDSLFPAGKVATVLQRVGMKVVDAPASVPEIFTIFGGIRIGPNEPGWSAPVSLGEKSIEGLHVVGTQRVYTMAAGVDGNQLTQILQAEPDAELFTVPASYKKTVVNPGSGTVVAVRSSSSTTATPKQ